MEPKSANISDFRFIKRLGNGSYGEVWLTEHKPTGQSYAMKILDSQKPKFNIDRVIRERQILAQSDHRNVVKMAYSFQEKHLFYMALEFHSRGNLNSLIDEFRTVHGQRGDALPEPLVRKILVDVIDALGYLHSNGIAHRDLKPENLLVAEDGTVILADFGLASIHTPIRSDSFPPERMTHPLGSGIASDLRASSVGSPLYRAPETFTEVLRKSPLPPYSTHLTDMWSLGIMAHELLTGTFALNKMVAPHDIDDMKELVREMRAYVGGTRPVFWPADVSVSRQAKSLIEQLLQSNPFARPSIDSLKSHPFFSGVDWDHLEMYRPVFVPVGPQSTTPTTQPGSLNLPAALLCAVSFLTPLYADRAAAFYYVSAAYLKSLNQKRVNQFVATLAPSTTSEGDESALRYRSSSTICTEGGDDGEEEFGVSYVYPSDSQTFDSASILS